MEFFHVLNRGVDKRNIALDDRDRRRFVHDLFVFNDTTSSANFLHPARRDETPRRPRKLLVHIHAFCLMPNHYHLLISEAVRNGMPLFMKKLNMGYAKYFNEKYKRTGALWQGKYKKIHIKRNAHFVYIPYYIHLNPLDMSMPEWREGKVKSAQDALAYLHNYRWSSHRDYLGVKNFPSITQRDILEKMLDSKEKYEKEIAAIVKNAELAAASASFE